MGSFTVSGLFAYPVKSCGGTPVERSQLGDRGLTGDRTFMIVDPDGRFVTQREEPRLALVRPTLNGDRLNLRTPGGAVEVVLPLPGPTRCVRVWEHQGPALDAGDEGAELLSEHLTRPVRLVGVSPDHARPVDRAHSDTGQVAFSDGYPILMIGDASLHDLNGRLPRPLPMQRFRPNITIAGSSAFAEDEWGRVRIAESRLQVVKTCARCTITTVNPYTGQRDGAEPLRTLGQYRRSRRGVLFGVNAIVRAPGPVAVGDPIVV